MKFIVSATQLITQDVQFIVDLPPEFDTEDAVEYEGLVRRTIEDFAAQDDAQIRSAVALYDSSDEVYHRNIVTNVRPATEEESK